MKHLPTINRIYKTDAIAGLKRLPSESVDLIITDPPYNIASKSGRTIYKNKAMSTMESFGEWDAQHPFSHEVMILALLDEAYRVLKKGGALYLFTARQDNGYYVRKALERGFTYRSQIISVKTPAMVAVFKNVWRSAFEICMYMTKGRVGTFNFPGHAEAVNVYQHHIRQKHSDHPTEKPLDLIKRFVSVSSRPGDLILDPFMGSGTTAVAAKMLGRHFLGFEINPAYIRMGRQRLRAVQGEEAGDRKRAA